MFRLIQSRKNGYSKSKGIGLVATVFLFMAAMLAIMFMVIMGSQADIFSTEVDIDVDRRTADISRSALMSSIVNDHLWRSENIEQCKYDNKLARDVLSRYFSTPGDQLYFGDSAVSKSEVESDLQEYFSYKLERHRGGPDPRGYRLRITHDSNSIEVSDEGSAETEWERTTFRPGLTGGEYALATLMIKNPEGASTAPSWRTAP